MMILAIDPGGMNGLCWWDDDYTLTSFDQIKLADLPSWLEDHEPIPDLIVYENYRLWKHKALQQAGSDIPAAQAVGMIKSFASRHAVKLIDQSPQILKQAELMSQMKMPADHSKSHWVSAYLHGYWYMTQQGYKKVDLGADA